MGSPALRLVHRMEERDCSSVGYHCRPHHWFELIPLSVLEGVLIEVDQTARDASPDMLKMSIKEADIS